LDNCGESWEISGVPDNESKIKNGQLSGQTLNQVIKEFKGRLLGKRVHEKFENEFPLLIKFIDANDDLSIQVHPEDKLAWMRHKSFGKTEMWYIIQADENAELIAGFNKGMNKKLYLKHFHNGTLMDVLNREKVNAGDVFFIPAGRIHTIGKGLLLAEIQQSSDVTYRIYDFDRKDSHGNTRELHIDEALDAIDYNFYPEYKSKYHDKSNQPVEIVRSTYFTTNKLSLQSKIKRNMKSYDSFVIYICLDGQGIIEHNDFKTRIGMGEVLLIPAEIAQYALNPEDHMKLLETYITKE
jgi:mannose-6-phosphate isomerase